MQVTTRNVWVALLALGVLLPLLTSPSHAAPVCDAATGHCYDTNVGQGLPADTWAGAAAAAATVVFNDQPGHLVTITSLAESLFVFDTLEAFPELGPWIGLRQLGQTVEPGSCAQGPVGGWTWVTGEPFYSGPSSCVFENWGLFPTEPNDTSGIEHCAHLSHRGLDAKGNQWNDIECDGHLLDFIIEWNVRQAEDVDGDGIPDNEDDCPNSDLSPTVVIDACNSGVSNTLFPSGCTVSDLIAKCAEGAAYHGQFVSCVADLTNDLKKAGAIRGQQKGAIQSCAAQADFP